MKWYKCKYENICDDKIVKNYQDFTILLCIPNGGIVAVSIFNYDQSIVETLDTEDFNKYTEEEWHINQAILRIEKILKTMPSKAYKFLQNYSIDCLRFIVDYHNIKTNKRSAIKMIKAIENSGIELKKIYCSLQLYKEPEVDLSDLPLFQ